MCDSIFFESIFLLNIFLASVRSVSSMLISIAIHQHLKGQFATFAERVTVPKRRASEDKYRLELMAG
ncbi:hypothetical protein D3C79_868030 [compost metagenome]